MTANAQIATRSAPGKPIPIRTVTAPVVSNERFTTQPNVRGLPDGKVLVNDARGKRLLVFDSTLATYTTSADSVRTTGVLYPTTGLINPLMRYIGDSTLIMDFEARSYVLIDPSGKMGRAMAVPVSRDIGIASRPFPGNPASDALGRLIYRAGDDGRPDRKPGDPPITATRDTIKIVRADFNTRTVDTIAAFSVPRVAASVFSDGPKGKTLVARTLNAGLTAPDEWAVLSDGTLAIVREHDYHIDWINSDGSTLSTEKLPFDWLRQTDEMKQARVDSMKRVIDSVNATGKAYGTTYLYNRRPDGTSKVDTIIPTITFSPLSEMADYAAPMRRGFTKADEDNNLWILPTTTTVAKGGLVYDVVNKKNGLFERVQLPPDCVIVGFGKGGVVYLARNEGATKTWALLRVRISHEHPMTGPRNTLDMTTWSVVGVDAKTGAVGVAMSSCVPMTLADALAALVPRKGAAATQAAFDVGNRNKVFEALKQGKSAPEIIKMVSDSATDPRIGNRQYGVVTMSRGKVMTAGFTGKPMLDGASAPNSTRYAGVMANAAKGVSAQGNTLVSSAVVGNALKAFVTDDKKGFNTLSDRLMRGVEAGSAAGGDVRCNTDSVRQTAATSMILVARGTDPPYATEKIGMSDQGTSNAPWLAISVTVEKGGANPLIELRKRYDTWRREHP